jgi:hypothetical protein
LFAFLQALHPPVSATLNLSAMRITRSAAKETEKSIAENGSPPAPQLSNENTKGTTTTASKSNARKKASKVGGKQSQPSQNVDAPSETAHSSDEVDESAGAGDPPQAKSPIPVSELFVTKFSAILNHPALYQQESSTLQSAPQAPEGVPQTPSPSMLLMKHSVCPPNDTL